MGNRCAMTCDRDGFTAFNLPQKLGQTCFGFGDSHLMHRKLPNRYL